MGSEVANNVGFGASDVYDCVIGSGNTQEARIDLGRSYALVAIFCENAANIADSTTMTLNVSPKSGVGMMNLYEQNDPATVWSKAIPATGSFYFVIPHAFGSRFVQPVLDTGTDGEVTIKIIGYDPVVIGQRDI